MKINSLYKLLISSYIFSTFSEGIIMPIYAIFVQKIGGNILDASGAMAIFFITEGVFTIIIHRPKWSNSHRATLLIGGWVIWLLGIIAYLFISNMTMLFVTQILTALGNAIADPVFYRELSDHTDRKSEEFEWGLFDGSKVILDGIAALLGGVIASLYGFRPLIFTMIGAATISLLIILYYIRKLRKMGLGEKMINAFN